eukprot:gb/GECG01012148.1/.p1 GENE.gb/GECG01012148.1/~~gb/GECG01012148.1/.p1  ORF type:complete len:381 (+),score=41.50 gb/GECG01012148.1/:1-1143(+)
MSGSKKRERTPEEEDQEYAETLLHAHESSPKSNQPQGTLSDDLQYGNSMLNATGITQHSAIFAEDFGTHEASVAQSLLDLAYGDEQNSSHGDNTAAGATNGERYVECGSSETSPFDATVIVPEHQRKYKSTPCAFINVSTKFYPQKSESAEALYNLFKDAAIQASNETQGDEPAFVLAPSGILGKAGHTSVFKHPLTNWLIELCKEYNVIICAGSTFLGPHLNGKFYEMGMVVGPQIPANTSGRDAPSYDIDVIGLYKARTVPCQRAISLAEELDGSGDTLEYKLPMQGGHYPAKCDTPQGKMGIVIDDDVMDYRIVLDQLKISPNFIIALSADQQTEAYYNAAERIERVTGVPVTVVSPKGNEPNVAVGALRTLIRTGH